MSLKYNSINNIISSDRLGDIKRINCPLNKSWEAMQVVDKISGAVQEERYRYCRSCSKNVFNLDGLTEEQIEGVLLSSPDVCIHASFPHPHIEVTGYSPLSKSGRPRHRASTCPTPLNHIYTEEPMKLRVIKTARSVMALNIATEEGNKALIKESTINNSEAWHTWLVKNKEDGKYVEVSDVRSLWSIKPVPLDFDNEASLIPKYLRSSTFDDSNNSFSYLKDPYTKPPKPWAAYIIPKDLEIGERVILEDLIEYRPQSTMGNRRLTAIATWTGQDFKIEEREPDFVVG